MTPDKIRELISRPGGYRLSDGVVATREGLVFTHSWYHLVQGFLRVGWFSRVSYRNFELVWYWPDAAERLRYRDGEPWCIASGTIIVCFGASVPIIYLDEERPLHRLAAILCDDAEAFRVLHYAVHNLGGESDMTGMPISSGQEEVWEDREVVLAEDYDRIAEDLTDCERERDRLKTDREGWAARSKEDSDRLGKALDPVRRKRSTGEPACSDGETVEELVAKYDRLKLDRLDAVTAIVRIAIHNVEYGRERADANDMKLIAQNALAAIKAREANDAST